MAKTALTDDMLTMAPGAPPALTCSTMWRATAWPARKEPFRLTRSTRSKSSSVRSRKSAACTMPALLTRMSMPPKASIAAATRLSMSSALCRHRSLWKLMSPSFDSSRSAAPPFSLSTIGDHHLGAVAQIALGDGMADARRPARNDRRLAVKRHFLSCADSAPLPGILPARTLAGRHGEVNRGDGCAPSVGAVEAYSKAHTPIPLAWSAALISSRIAGSSIVAGTFGVSPSAICRMVPRRIFPERVFGRRLTMMHRAEGGDRADSLAHPRDAFALDLGRVARDARPSAPRSRRAPGPSARRRRRSPRIRRRRDGRKAPPPWRRSRGGGRRR